MHTLQPGKHMLTSSLCICVPLLKDVKSYQSCESEKTNTAVPGGRLYTQLLYASVYPQGSSILVRRCILGCFLDVKCLLRQFDPYWNKLRL